MNNQITTTEAILSPENFDHSMKIAKELSRSDLVPPHFRDKPQNVVIVMSLAHNLGINVPMALQQISVIGGKPCMSSALMISLLNNAKCLNGPLMFKYDGKPASPERSCTAYGIDASTGQKIEGQPFSLAMAQADGYTRNAKYKSLPDLMLQWRAASFFVRAYYPQVVLGLHSSEELDDVQVAAAAPTGSARERLAQIRETQQPAIRDVTPAQEESPPVAVVEAGEPEAREAQPGDGAEPPDDTLIDFLNAIAEETDADALTTMARQCSDFDTPAKVKTAKRAVMEQAQRNGYAWNKQTEQFE